MIDRIKPGDYILCEDVPGDMRGAVDAAFVAAAGGERGELANPWWEPLSSDWALGLDPDYEGRPYFGGSKTGASVFGGGRRLTLGQVLGLEPMPNDGASDNEQAADPINHPNHYNQGGIECIDAIEAALGTRGALDYCRGCAIKYHWRMMEKGGSEDARKAAWYSEKAAELADKLESDQ